VETNYGTILSTTFPEHYNSVRIFVTGIEELNNAEGFVNFMLIFSVLAPIIGLSFKYHFLYHKGGAYVTGKI
jgi:hypothetical protein